ncbi:MAG: nucleolar RNA-binding Nop10p family protein [Acidilobaceae archaeon]
MRKCVNCGRYTLRKDKCPYCGRELIVPHPQKIFSTR